MTGDKFKDVKGAQMPFSSGLELLSVGIYLVRWGWQSQTKPWGGTVPPPDGRPRAQVKERAGRNTLLLIVRR